MEDVALGRHHIRLRCTRAVAIGNVGSDGCSKQPRVLRHDTDAVAKPVGVYRAQIMTVQRHGA
eukprot:355021-Chlamydomonas_euryale.AAC.9